MYKLTWIIVTVVILIGVDEKYLKLVSSGFCLKFHHYCILEQKATRTRKFLCTYLCIVSKWIVVKYKLYVYVKLKIMLSVTQRCCTIYS